MWVVPLDQVRNVETLRLPTETEMYGMEQGPLYAVEKSESRCFKKVGTR